MIRWPEWIGWRAEEDEFMERPRTLKVGEGAFPPIVHLWHIEAQKRAITELKSVSQP
jgi:hypothetical protein